MISEAWIPPDVARGLLMRQRTRRLLADVVADAAVAEKGAAMELGSPISSVVFEHNFDPEMLEQFGTLRTIRLNLAETMLRNIDKVGRDLVDRGLADASEAMDQKKLKTELEERCATLRARLQRPDVVFADEISLYVDLLEADVAQELTEG